MTKIFLKAITGLFLTAIISGCAYYKYTKNRQDNITNQINLINGKNWIKGIYWWYILEVH
ncbi:MAG: hypothetical protein IPK31_07075 [Chitinophagaceae bacterium]|nr:hypothetical protein [Chitinophagaceae bacterium]